MDRPGLDIRADMSIADKVKQIQSFLGNRYFDPSSGIMYTLWYWKDDELRPFRSTDRREGQNYPQTKAGFSFEGYCHGENGPMMSGFFLQSQCLRYHATGDAQALEFARKAFNSLQIIYHMGEEHGREGLLGKPYDWRFSEETSVDQYIGAMMGLWEYWCIADRITRQRIAQMLGKMADWWRKAEYKIVYFERHFDLLPYHAPRMACLNAIAYRVTDDPQYARESDRMWGLCGTWATTYDNQLLKILHSDPASLTQNSDFFGYDPSLGKFKFRTREVSAEMYLGLACADWFMAHDSARGPLLKHVIARYWRQMQYGLRDDFMTLYGIEVDLEHETWSTVHTELTDETRKNALAGSLLSAYYSEACWQDHASRIPDASIIAHQHAPEFSPNALDLASRMLQRLDNQRMHHFVDPDGRQLVPELDWIRNVLSGDVPVFTVLTYWRAKARLSGRCFNAFAGG
ncbi:MAG: hypothetical protein IT447_11530 [Phycisphaerales bacterium]|nr:hypothetical protein [Phycisphaerales bacterium]